MSLTLRERSSEEAPTELSSQGLVESPHLTQTVPPDPSVKVRLEDSRYFAALDKKSQEEAAALDALLKAFSEKNRIAMQASAAPAAAAPVLRDQAVILAVNQAMTAAPAQVTLQQGTVDWETKYREMEAKRRAEAPSHPNERFCLGTGGKRLGRGCYQWKPKEQFSGAVCTTCGPEIDRQGRTESRLNWRQQVKDAKTEAEAAMLAQKPGDVFGMLRLYSVLARRQPPTDRLQGKQLSNLQLEIKALLETEPDDRKMVWIADPFTGTGKTTYLQSLESKSYYGADGKLREDGKFDVYYLDNCSRTEDVYHRIAEARKSGWTGRICAINMGLSRNKRYSPISYAVLESLKDGRVGSVKYHGYDGSWVPGHVIILSNHMPDLNQLSPDRVTVYEVLLKTGVYTLFGVNPRGNGVCILKVDESRVRDMNRQHKGWMQAAAQSDRPPQDWIRSVAKWCLDWSRQHGPFQNGEMAWLHANDAAMKVISPEFEPYLRRFGREINTSFIMQSCSRVGM